MPKSKVPAHVVKRDREGLIRCRVCGCTENDACPAGCSWYDLDLCTVCRAVVVAIAEWTDAARHVNRAALWREVGREVRGEVFSIRRGRQRSAA